MREIQVHHRKTQDYDHKIKDAEPGGSGATPCGCARKLQISGVEQEYEERHHVLGIVIPILTGEAVNPDKTENCSDRDGEEPNENTGTAHALEDVKRGKTPDDIAEFAVAQKAVLGEVNEAENKGQGEGGVGQDAEGHVQSEDRTARRRGGEAVGWGEMSGEEKDQDERDDESAHGTLPMVELESEIGNGEEPAEEGHGAVQVVIWDGVEAAGALEESEIVRDEAEAEKDGTEAAGELTARVEIAGIRTKTEGVGEQGQR
jgi:hypothetical protein